MTARDSQRCTRLPLAAVGGLNSLVSRLDDLVPSLDPKTFAAVDLGLNNWPHSASMAPPIRRSQLKPIPSSDNFFR